MRRFLIGIVAAMVGLVSSAVTEVSSMHELFELPNGEFFVYNGRAIVVDMDCEAIIVTDETWACVSFLVNFKHAHDHMPQRGQILNSFSGQMNDLKAWIPQHIDMIEEAPEIVDLEPLVAEPGTNFRDYGLHYVTFPEIIIDLYYKFPGEGDVKPMPVVWLDGSDLPAILYDYQGLVTRSGRYKDGTAIIKRSVFFGFPEFKLESIGRRIMDWEKSHGAPSGIEGMTADDDGPAEYFDLMGRRLAEPKGICIERRADGSVRKIAR